MSRDVARCQVMSRDVARCQVMSGDVTGAVSLNQRPEAKIQKCEGKSEHQLTTRDSDVTERARWLRESITGRVVACSVCRRTGKSTEEASSAGRLHAAVSDL